MNPKIVTVEIVASREKHPDADRLHVYTLSGKGWQVVSNVKYEPGDKVAYVHTDTVAPKTDEYAFLEQSKYRIKPIKLRGVKSIGMLIPLKGGLQMYPVGLEIGKELGFSKYIKPQPVNLSGDVAGAFPKEILPQTDEERLQNYPELIDELKDCGVAYATVKHDGSSGTFIKEADGTFKVCSRNNELKETDGNAFWKVAKKYHLKDKMLRGTAIQGELVGPKVQGNPEKLPELDLRVFNLWYLEDGRFASLPELDLYCNEVISVPMVSVYKVYDSKEIPASIEAMEKESLKVLYFEGQPAEGLVWRPMYPRWSKTLQKWLSFKVINDDYKD